MSEDEYEYTDSDSDDMDIHIILNPEDQKTATSNLDQDLDSIGEGKVWVNDEENKSAFDIDINRLKTKKWTMTGDESDYFNYGMNESMWKVFLCPCPVRCRNTHR